MRLLQATHTEHCNIWPANMALTHMGMLGDPHQEALGSDGAAQRHGRRDEEHVGDAVETELLIE